MREIRSPFDSWTEKWTFTGRSYRHNGWRNVLKLSNLRGTRSQIHYHVKAVEYLNSQTEKEKQQKHSEQWKKQTRQWPRAGYPDQHAQSILGQVKAAPRGKEGSLEILLKFSWDWQNPFHYDLLTDLLRNRENHIAMALSRQLILVPIEVLSHSQLLIWYYGT